MNHPAIADRVITLGMPAPPIKAGALAYEAEDEHDAIAWARSHVKHANVKACVLITQDWLNDNPEGAQLLHASLKSISDSARIDQNTLEERAEHMALAFAGNLRRLRHWATDVDSPMRGEPAFIVGAGSSLDANVHLMSEAASKGYVFAVNTSCGAVAAHCDVVFCSESKDVSTGLNLGPHTVHVLEMTAGAENWECDADLKLAVACLDPPTVDHVLRMGGMPISYTGTCTAGAYALAKRWGCDPIVLVGQDMAYLGNGRFYAQGTPFADIRWEQHENLVKFTGQSKQMPDTEIVWAPGIGGGLVPSSAHLVDFARHFSKLAEKDMVFNCSEQGISIPNTHEYTLREALDMMEPIDKRPIWAPKFTSGVFEAARIKRGLRKIIEADDPHWAMHEVPMMAMMAVPEVMRMNRLGTLNPAQRRERLHAHVKRSAELLMEVL